MNIIGHRGAAGLALENTLESLNAAVSLGVPEVEIDVWLTKDNEVVLCHDPHLTRVAGENRFISDLTYDQLQKIKLHNNETVPLLSEALKVVKSTKLIIETKEEGIAERVLTVIRDLPETQVIITSIKPSELEAVKRVRPGLKTYLKAVVNPLEVIYIARSIKADGLNLNFWILNPLTYLMARRHNLEIMVYTIDSRFLVGFIHLLYPKARICTNLPNRFINRHER